ncbi:cell division suppressor protein YneA [Cytobacillus sp. Hm23]
MKQSKIYYILFFTVFIGFAFALITSYKDIEKNDYIIIKVEDGDTLWDIASEYSNSHDLSINDFISWVEDVNQIAPDSIFYGDEIYIPVLKSEGNKMYDTYAVNN